MSSGTLPPPPRIPRTPYTGTIIPSVLPLPQEVWSREIAVASPPVPVRRLPKLAGRFPRPISDTMGEEARVVGKLAPASRRPARDPPRSRHRRTVQHHQRTPAPTQHENAVGPISRIAYRPLRPNRPSCSDAHRSLAKSMQRSGYRTPQPESYINTDEDRMKPKLAIGIVDAPPTHYIVSRTMRNDHEVPRIH